MISALPLSLSLSLSLLLILFCVAIVGIVVLLPPPSAPDQTPAAEGLFAMAERDAVFLFDDTILVDTNTPARALLAGMPLPEGEWAWLMAFLTPRFAGVEDLFERLGEQDRIALTAPDGLRLLAQRHAGRTRITLTAPLAEGASLTVDGLSQRALEEELIALRRTTDLAPIPIWRQNAEGAVTWANPAYLALAGTSALTWPLPRLFAPQGTGTGSPRRLEASGAAGHWFDCHSHPMSGETLHFGLPADALIRAEKDRRDFVQTLTKTFAQLAIGLAIFDRDRHLVLFNPALTDLTALKVSFLAARPSLFTFLDQLREKRMIPEYRDYKSWRQQMVEMEHAASFDRYEETWSLPTGQTYRITGRPHPGGALALLMEDITSETALNRRFRAELELGQAVLDGLEEAIAVFSASGTLILSNTAYARLWGDDPGVILAETGIQEALHHWQRQTHPAPVWGRIRDFVGHLGERGPWQGQAHLRDGRSLRCRGAPLSGGASLIGFRVETAPDPEAGQTI